MELVHFKIQTMETLCKPLINTSAEHDDISDYHDEDEEGVLQYGTSAWTSDPHTGSGAVIAIFLGQCKTYCFYNCSYNYYSSSVKLFSCDEWKTFRKQHNTFISWISCQ